MIKAIFFYDSMFGLSAARHIVQGTGMHKPEKSPISMVEIFDFELLSLKFYSLYSYNPDYFISTNKNTRAYRIKENFGGWQGRRRVDKCGHCGYN